MGGEEVGGEEVVGSSTWSEHAPGLESTHTHTHTSVLARPVPKGTEPFGASNVPFGSAPKQAMCPLGQPQTDNFPFVFSSHLNYLNL